MKCKNLLCFDNTKRLYKDLFKSSACSAEFEQFSVGQEVASQLVKNIANDEIKFA